MKFSIPHVYATGTHYEVGYEMGKSMKERIHTYLNEFEDFKTKIIPFIETESGKQIFEQFVCNQTRLFPWYVDEIRGIADGACLSFEWIFAINLRVEIQHLCDNNAQNCNLIKEHKQIVVVAKECSDFHLINESNFLLAHNEDSSASNYHTGYLVTLRIKSSDYYGRQSPSEDFTCYCYPAHLPGNAYGSNASGFVFGVNALYPKIIAIERTPRQFINRAMMSIKTLEELENLILNTPISYGVSLNVGCCTKDLNKIKSKWTSEYKNENSNESDHEIPIYPILWNYELAPNIHSNKCNQVSKHCVILKSIYDQIPIEQNKCFYSACNLNHFNHYNRIKLDECVVTSSRRRQARVDTLKPATNARELLEFTSDTGDAEFPVFRSSNATDPGKTVSTVLFNLHTGIMNLYFGKPSGDYELLIRLPIVEPEN